ncbi:MAG: hypothetical protein IAE65_11330 [Ignavibacteria bacterium]|nr:hypothetical protein [Ignavibacteria bacterium]
MTEEQRIVFEDFLILQVEDYYRLDLSTYNFQTELDRLNNSVIDMLKKTIDIYLKIYDSFNSQITSILINQVKQIFNILGLIKNLDLIKDAKNNMSKTSDIKRNIDSYINQLYRGYNSSQDNFNYENVNLFSICNNINIEFYHKEILKLDLNKLQDEYNEKKKSIDTLIIDSNETINELKKAATVESVKDYSLIFKTQAEEYSSNKLSKPKKAELWLIFSFSLVIITFGFLIFIMFSFTNSYRSINLGNASVLFTKISILVLLIYLIKNGFKQYSINKHLYSLNIHRKNVLNSYKLLIESIDVSNVDIRNAIVMEVSKAIYESGKTGYIDSKSDEVSNPSIIEITKLLNNKS